MLLAEHVTLHPPQLPGLVVVSTQTVLQHVCAPPPSPAGQSAEVMHPAAHMYVLAKSLQICPIGQVFVPVGRHTTQSPLLRSQRGSSGSLQSVSA
jgi:hypothetical protein